MTVRCLIINDPHLAASPPAGAKDIWVDDVKSMLTQARDYARQYECLYTVFTGDFWHSKNNVPHWIVRWAIELLKDWPGTKLAIVGNHDLGHRGIDSIERQPIGVLFEAGVLTWLKEDLITDDNGIRIQWSPCNYFDEVDGVATKPPFENRNAAHYGLKRQKGVDWAIKVAHGQLMPPGKTLPYAYTPYDAVPHKGMDVLAYGHPHFDTSCVEDGDVWFCSYGSLGRVARTKENRTRPMRLLMLKLMKDTIEREILPLQSVASDDLFYEMEKDGVELTAPMERFARSVRAALSSNDLGSLEESVEIVGKDVDSRAKRRLLSYIERASE